MLLFSVRDLLLMFLALLVFICLVDWAVAKKSEDIVSRGLLFLASLGLLLFIAVQEVRMVFWPNPFCPSHHYVVVTTKSWGTAIIPYLGYLLNFGFWPQLILGKIALIGYILLAHIVASWVAYLWTRVFNFITFLAKYYNHGLGVFGYFLFLLVSLVFTLVEEVRVIYWSGSHFAIFITKHFGFFHLPCLGYLLNCGYWLKLFFLGSAVFGYMVLTWVFFFKVIPITIEITDSVIFYWREILILCYLIFIMYLYVELWVWAILLAFVLIRRQEED